MHSENAVNINKSMKKLCSHSLSVKKRNISILKFLRVSMRNNIWLFHELFTNHIFLFCVVCFVFVLYAFPPYYLIIMPGKKLFFLTDRFFVVVSLAIAPVPRQWIKPSIVIIATAMTTIHIHRHHADDICVVVVDASSSTSCPVVLLYVEHSSFAIRRSSLI